MNYEFIPVEDIQKKYQDHTFWCVYNKTDDKVVSSPLFGDMRSITIFFVEKEDAETAKFILSKAVDAAGKELVLLSGKWEEIDNAVFKTEGQYQWAAIDHEQAQILFEPARDLLRTRDFEENK